ncbi:YmiA family putative membrane protein [Erwinia sp. BNK-24-b]|uniref:YmiA family putative membrane protein n=1 Tax=Erwinia TaxID=551 RepID=UPI001FEEE0C6|nr:YmiA family putative membrane protein [Erwinia phyllosphaerae]MBV4366952.1 YmiA family putative membrane protein [Erwinia phyllosphaerae]
MASRITVETDFGHKALKVRRNSNLRRKAWLAVFAVSVLFWGAAASLIWHIWG